MEYNEAVAWVHSLPRFSHKASLDSIKALLCALNNPQDKLKFVHIAGTNGKGSACVMLSNILKEAGYKTGLNISPFIIDFCERFQINGNMISQSSLAQILNEVKQATELVETAQPIVEFEAVTAAALLWFAKEGCDIVCLEVGLGGRFDATNAVENTLLSCVMHIAKDHTEYLGDTLDKIAFEKCGILKNNCEVVVYPQQENVAMDTIVECAKQKNCQLTVPDMQDFYFYKSIPFENRINYGGYDIIVPFCGKHQAYNTSVALEAALCLCKKGFIIDDEHIVKGIQSAVMPARIEVLAKQPLILLDSAHNLDGIMALVQTLKAQGCNRMIAIIGILQDKTAKEMLEALSPCFHTVYTVAPDNPRAVSAAQLAEIAVNYFENVEAFDNLQYAINKAKALNTDICVCGSMYLAAQARKIFYKS